jgi:hypothetical protein
MAALSLVVIGEGHKKWRAQTGITFQVITSGISPIVVTKENFF